MNGFWPFPGIPITAIALGLLTTAAIYITLATALTPAHIGYLGDEEDDGLTDEDELHERLLYEDYE